MRRVNPFASYVTAKLQLGKQPLQPALGGRYYLDAPDGGPERGIRSNVIPLFPK